MITRQDYQLSRFKQLTKYIDIEKAEGLEIGACDLPTVPKGIGRCEYADFRSSEELIQSWQLPPETVVPVKYVIDRNVALHLQIDRKFNYIILCHVIEHVPNVIGYLQSLRKLLRPNGIILITCPDKRRTPDVSRPSTTVEHLMGDYYYASGYPAFEHVLESGKAFLEEISQKSRTAPREFYEWACANFESGFADTHCHVWTDEEFFNQIKYLIEGKLLNGLEVAGKFPNAPEYNEFSIILQAKKPEKLPRLKQNPRYSETEKLRLELNHTLADLQAAQAQIEAMESSKFWKLRQSWFAFKKKIGLLSNE